MEFMETVISNITLKQVFDFIVGVIAVLSVIVEFSRKISFRPWSFILSYLGKAINSDLKEKLDEVERQQNTLKEAVNALGEDMEKRFNESATAADKKEAKLLRSRIIEFADNCRIHQKHTKTAFENITRDYDDYMEYCRKRNIPNHFIDAEFAYIREVYAQCQEENKFI